MFTQIKQGMILPTISSGYAGRRMVMKRRFRTLSVMGMIATLCVVWCGAGQMALAQCDEGITKLLASDGEVDDHFGISVSVISNVVIIGSYCDDDNGTDSGSVYIFRYDGSEWIEETKLFASDEESGDLFGRSVSISGEVIVIGAYNDDNDNGIDSGSAYIFRYDGNSWIEEAKLLASDGASGDWFGNSISISSDTIVVGAWFDGDNGYRSGAAYVFHNDGSEWIEETKLLASDGAEYDRFGESVSIDGDVIVIGTSEDDDNGDRSGSAYVFRYDGNSWIEEAKLLASDGAADDYFGLSVSISGDATVIGANGDDDGGSGSGSAYVYRNDGNGNWFEEAKLLASDRAPFDRFGNSVSIQGEFIVVGTDGDDNIGEDSGSAYFFHDTGKGNWIEEVKLLAFDREPSDRFGFSVSINGDMIAVGAIGDDDNGSGSGSSYVLDLFFILRIIQQPDDLIIISGDQACFSVTIEGGVGEVAYQWRRNGHDLTDGGKISGSNTDMLYISNVSRNDEGIYDVIITDDCGSITSDPAQLFVVDPVLGVIPSCPDGGPITVGWTNAYPGGEAAVLFSKHTGRLFIPGGFPCAGTRLDLGTPVRVSWQGYAGDDGSRTLYGSAPDAACGGYMQLIDLTTCVTSNVVLLE